MAERELLITHPIGATGRFRLTTWNGDLRIEGIDGDTAEVRARYRAPSGVTPSDDPESDGVVRVERQPGALTIAVADSASGSGFIAGLTRMVGASRPDVDFEVRVPRGATVTLESTSADGELRGLRGDQDIRTVSGDLELHGAGGRLRVVTVSGDVAITGDVLRLTANTTSGDIAVDAELVQELSARAVSGDISIRAALGRDAVHSFDSVSGDLQLATASGVAVELRGLSGSVRSDQPNRREVRDGKKLLVVGDGAVLVRARTVSGDVVVTGPRGSGRMPASDPFGYVADMDAFGREMDAFRADITREVAAVTKGWAGGAGGWPTPPSPPSLPSLPSAPTPPSPPSPPTAPARPAAPPPPESPTAAAQLAILRQLEQGEIDVDEAARRLEALA